MTPFHASELLAKNSSILTRLTYEQKLSLLKYIILNDPDPGLVLELELLPLANNQFITFQTKQASMIYIVDHNPEFLQLFHVRQHDRFLSPHIDRNLYGILSSKNFQGKKPFFALFGYRSLSLSQIEKKGIFRCFIALEVVCPLTSLAFFSTRGRGKKFMTNDYVERDFVFALEQLFLLLSSGFFFLVAVLQRLIVHSIFPLFKQRVHGEKGRL